MEINKLESVWLSDKEIQTLLDWYAVCEVEGQYQTKHDFRLQKRLEEVLSEMRDRS